MKPIFSCLFFTLLLSSCHITNHSKDGHDKGHDSLYPLVHIVYFKIKDDVDVSDFIKEIHKLKDISTLKNLEIGTFKDLGDKRALSEYRITMKMSFANEQDYITYQKHPIHLALKKYVGSYLAGPPLTYDYIRSEE